MVDTYETPKFIAYLLQRSMACTFKRKMRMTSVNLVFQKYGSEIKRVE